MKIQIQEKEWDSEQGGKTWSALGMKVEQPNSMLAEVRGLKKKGTEEDLEGLLSKGRDG